MQHNKHSPIQLILHDEIKEDCSLKSGKSQLEIYNLRILGKVRIPELVRESLATVMWKLLAFPSVKIHLYLELSILLCQRDKVKSDGNGLSYSWSRIITPTKTTSRTLCKFSERVVWYSCVFFMIHESWTPKIPTSRRRYIRRHCWRGCWSSQIVRSRSNAAAKLLRD